jgi:plasmid stabilization system protein ParE
MARISVAPSARDELVHLIAFLNLPGDTRARVRARIRPLAEAPERGAPLGGRWVSFRFILGPWPWMLIVYSYDADADQVSVVTIQDARRANAATAGG